MDIHEQGSLSAAIIDHNRLYRAGLRMMLESANIEVCVELDDLEAAAEGSSGASGCELVLIKMPPPNMSVTVVENARRAFPAAKVVLVADDLHPTRMMKAIEVGADGVLLADQAPDVFLQSLRLIRLGEKILPARLTSVLMGVDAGIPEVPHDFRACGLSEREVEILRLLVDGRQNKEIALRLDVTEGTVKVHVKALLRKIGASNRTQAAVWAMNHGLGPEQDVYREPATA